MPARGDCRAAPLGRTRVDSDSRESRIRDLSRARSPYRFVSSLLAQGLPLRCCSAPAQLRLSDGCKPRHFRAPFFIKTMGACAFDPETLSFAGTPVEQAMCLMRGMDATRNLGPPLQTCRRRWPAASAKRPACPPATRWRLSLQARSRMGFRRPSVAAGVARARQRSRCAAGALFRHPRYQRPGLRPPRLSGRHQDDVADQQSAKFRLLRTAGDKAHVVVNRTGEMLVDPRFRNSVARDQVRASRGIRRRAARTCFSTSS